MAKKRVGRVLSMEKVENGVREVRHDVPMLQKEGWERQGWKQIADVEPEGVEPTKAPKTKKTKNEGDKQED